MVNLEIVMMCTICLKIAHFAAFGQTSFESGVVHAMRDTDMRDTAG
jgi:hypothetical protein